jgi:hypothetical protein
MVRLKLLNVDEYRHIHSLTTQQSSSNMRPATFKSTIVCNTSTRRLMKNQLTEVHLYVHYNNSKYLYRSLIRRCTFKHCQSHMCTHRQIYFRSSYRGYCIKASHSKAQHYMKTSNLIQGTRFMMLLPLISSL